MFEVHYWPWTGRVLTVHIPAGTSRGAVTMEVTVTGGDHRPDLYDNTMLVALALAEAGDPPGELFKHKLDGEIVQVERGSLREVVVRQHRAATQ